MPRLNKTRRYKKKQNYRTKRKGKVSFMKKGFIKKQFPTLMTNTISNKRLWPDRWRTTVQSNFIGHIQLSEMNTGGFYYFLVEMNRCHLPFNVGLAGGPSTQLRWQDQIYLTGYTPATLQATGLNFLMNSSGTTQSIYNRCRVIASKISVKVTNQDGLDTTAICVAPVNHDGGGIGQFYSSMKEISQGLNASPMRQTSLDAANPYGNWISNYKTTSKVSGASNASVRSDEDYAYEGGDVPVARYLWQVALETTSDVSIQSIMPIQCNVTHWAEFYNAFQRLSN